MSQEAEQSSRELFAKVLVDAFFCFFLEFGWSFGIEQKDKCERDSFFGWFFLLPGGRKWGFGKQFTICPKTITEIICFQFLRCKDYVTAPETNSPKGPTRQKLQYGNRSNSL